MHFGFSLSSACAKLLCLFGLLAVAHGLNAQGGPSRPPVDAPRVQARAIWVPGGALSGVELLVGMGGSDTQPISPSLNRRSRPWPVKEVGKPFLLFARPVGGPPPPAPGTSGGKPPGPPLPLKIGEIAWPTVKSSEYLLLIAGQPGQQGRVPAVRGVAVADGLDVFPLHTVRVANFTSRPLFAKVGGKMETIAPGISSPIPYGAIAAEGEKKIPLFPVALARALPDGANEVFYNGEGEGYRGSRLLCVVANGATPEAAPAVQLVVDFAQPNPAAAPGARRP